MSRYIDADALKEKFTSKWILDRIDEQPTADVVEVVRCKNCTRQMICFHSDDYFCADGERREDV